MHIFLDESGQFNKRSPGDYFVIGSFTIGNPNRTEKQFRSWCRSRFPRKMRCQSEIKFSSGIDDRLRLRTLRNIANLDVRIRYCYFRRENIPHRYWSDGRLQSGRLYVDIVRQTLEQYLPVSDLELRVFCDHRHLKGISKGEFGRILKETFLLKLLPKSIFQAEMVDSTANANIQIADWITGALALYLEGNDLGNECYGILKNNILGYRELFADGLDENDDIVKAPA